MTTDRSKRDTVLGVVFFLGLGLLLWSTFNLGSLSLQPVQTLVVRFANAGGLRDGDPVYVLGRRAGQVVSVVYAENPDRPDLRITVELRMHEPVQLKRSYEIKIKDANLLAGKSVDIDPGRPGDAEPAVAPLAGRTTGSPLDSLGETFAGEDNRANLSAALAAIRATFESATNPQGTIGALLKERLLHDRVLAAAENLDAILDSVRRGRGLFGRLTADDQLADDVAAAAHNIRAITDKVNQGTGPLGRLVDDQKMGQDLADFVADARLVGRNLVEAKGALGVLISDPESGEKTRNILADVQGIARKANDPQAGLVGSLLGDAETGQQGRLLVANLSEVSNRLVAGDGLLPRLINDKDMAEKLDRIFTQVSRALEDAREAAPVGTFIQVIGGIF